MNRQVGILSATDGPKPVSSERRSIASFDLPCQNGGARFITLIVNADDWGRDRETTERTLECIRRATVSSVSAMVFMQDSDRAAALARESAIDTGLHLNFTAPFSAPDCPTRLAEHQRRTAQYLLRYPLARVIFHPNLVRSFEYVVAAQLEEFRSIYGSDPDRVDGHHHLHLCANVLFKGLLPPGIIVRRNFSFQPGEKSFCNRFYRKMVDRWLARSHRLVDYLFSLPPLEPASRMERICNLARQHVVELETHPINPEEYRFLMEGELSRRLGDLRIAPRFALHHGPSKKKLEEFSRTDRDGKDQRI